jgi:uncharacterized protein
MRAIILPGNGNCDISSQWYLSVKEELENFGLEVVAENMPDANLARKEYWLPWIEEKSKGEDKVVLIGHSSGAVAILRFLENHKAEGAVLVCPCHTDLGLKKEKESHYFDDPWQWDKIKRNAKWIIQYASTDDPFIPIEEARFIKDKINSEYYEFNDQKHFSKDTSGKVEFPELVKAVKSNLAN